MKAVLLAALLLATPAAAQDHPPTMPARDVDIVYRIAGPTEQLEQRLRWGVSLGKLRVDPPTPGLFVVIDTTTHAMQAVREGDRSVVQLDPGPIPGTALEGKFRRRGEAQIAGLACTQWETQDTGRRTVLACLTPDGVLLQVQADGLILLQATEVTFAPQPEAVFRVPADYRKVTQPVSRRRP